MVKGGSRGNLDRLNLACDDWRYCLLGCDDYQSSYPDRRFAATRQNGLKPWYWRSPCNFWMNSVCPDDRDTRRGERMSVPEVLVIMDAALGRIVAVSVCTADIETTRESRRQGRTTDSGDV